ncbi:hypothetical protein SAMN05660733_06420 [Lentzea albidocapillata]|uniref:Repeat domain-containing protein n=2 Tax=Lentzea albidocapillata TaxID=40571 RepID=A0A1W2FHS2_9PSEU|nr:hypothetical protein SAMN05660733_06420 [Lentzea albidocapillata]
MSGQGDWANYKAITAGDFNGDGKTDIAGIDPGNTMVYFAGNGAGRLYWGGTMSGQGDWANYKTII